jgi:hypothetical protein
MVLGKRRRVAKPVTVHYWFWRDYGWEKRYRDATTSGCVKRTLEPIIFFPMIYSQFVFCHKSE